SVRVSLTGRLTIETAEGVLDENRLPGRQGRVVLAYLIAEHGRPVPRDELAEALWGDRLPATWEKALAVIVSKLRGRLDEGGLRGSEALTHAFGCYQLSLPPESWVDLAAVHSAVEQAELALADGRLDAATSEATVAAELARRPFLPGEEADWVESKRRELR